LPHRKPPPEFYEKLPKIKEALGRDENPKWYYAADY
jgi:hypothetical protein